MTFKQFFLEEDESHNKPEGWKAVKVNKLPVCPSCIRENTCSNCPNVIPTIAHELKGLGVEYKQIDDNDYATHPAGYAAYASNSQLIIIVPTASGGAKNIGTVRNWRQTMDDFRIALKRYHDNK